jgi:sulfite reductase (ferredoxin)
VKDFKEETSTPVIVNNIVSCTGADTCRLGIGLSKGLAAAIRKELLQSDLQLDRLRAVTIHVTGCPNCCGQQLWADLGFAGRVLRNDRAYPGYQIYLAANRMDRPAFAEPVGSLSARRIPEFVRRLLQAYQPVAKYISFTAYLKEEGRDVALQLIDELKPIPSFADDKNFYFDWGAEEIFSVASRGKAECSAGLFDMIKVDQDNIAAHRAALSEAQDAAARHEHLYQIIYAASRMLLVTRGLDPKNTEDVFDNFIEYFITPGFVDERYRPLILDARTEPATSDFAAQEALILALADDVNALYASMDDSMQFKAKAPVKAAPAAPKAEVSNSDAPKAEFAPQKESRRVKDLRGVLCPMNFVKTKLELAAMQSGELLEIWLDDGKPIENVPGSVRLEGHEVLEQEPVEDYWRVLIRKK